MMRDEKRKAEPKGDAEPGEGVPSPCIGVCRMDERTGLCEGCLRTRDEIASWLYAADEEKRRIRQRLAERRIARGIF